MATGNLWQLKLATGAAAGGGVPPLLEFLSLDHFYFTYLLPPGAPLFVTFSSFF
jgi:hypothetical protein